MIRLRHTHALYNGIAQRHHPEGGYAGSSACDVLDMVGVVGSSPIAPTNIHWLD